MKLGIRLLAATMHPSTWAVRWSERVEHPQHDLVRRRVRLDVSVLASYPRWDGRVLLPVRVGSPGEPETEVTDEEGVLLPTLSGQEVHDLLVAGIEGHAALHMRIPVLHDWVRDQLLPENRSTPEPPPLIYPRTEEERAFRPVELAAIRSQIALLDGDQRLKTLRKFVWTRSVGVVAAPPLARQVLTFELHEQSRSERAADTEGSAPRRAISTLRRLNNRLGEMEVEFSAVGMLRARHYELQIEAPYDIWFSDGAVLVRRQLVDGGASEWARDDAIVCSVRDPKFLSVSAPAKSSEEVLLDAQIAARLHLFPTGLVRTGALVALFTLAVYVAATVAAIISPAHRVGGPDISGGVVSLLLVVQGVVGPLIATPSRHSLTTALQWPIRLTLYLLGVVSFGVACAVAFGASGSLSLAIWYTATSLACLASYLLLAQRFRLMRAQHPGSNLRFGYIRSRIPRPQHGLLAMACLMLFVLAAGSTLAVTYHGMTTEGVSLLSDPVTSAWPGWGYPLPYLACFIVAVIGLRLLLQLVRGFRTGSEARNG